MQLLHLPPEILAEPPVRLTSVMSEDMAEAFRSTVAHVGIKEVLSITLELTPGLSPIVTDETLLLVTHPVPHAHYWIVNGLHRAQEGVANNIPTVPCNTSLGTMSQVVADNWITTGLQGKPPVSQVRKVIRYWEEEEGLDVVAIRRKYGIPQAYLENLMWVNRAIPDVQDAVDEGLISVGHGVAIARIDNLDVQERVLAHCLGAKLALPALKEHIGLVEQYLSGNIPVFEVPPPAPPPELKCGMCRGAVDPAHYQTYGMCIECADKAWTATREVAQRVAGKASPPDA